LSNERIAQLQALRQRRGVTLQFFLREAIDDSLRRAGLLSSSAAVPAPGAPAEPWRPRVDPSLREAKAAIAGLEIAMLRSTARALENSGSTERPPRSVNELLEKAAKRGLR
jgi:hypothetical protein